MEQVYRNVSTSQVAKHRLPVPRGHVDLIVFDSHDHVPVLVVSEHPGAGLLEAFERLGGGMAVGVARANLDNGYLEPEAAEEEGRGGGVGAVMGDLEDQK